MPNLSDDKSTIIKCELNRWIRPADIKQHTDSRVYATANSPALINGFFAVTYDMDSTPFDCIGPNRIDFAALDSANSYMNGKSKITLHQLSNDPSYTNW